MLAAAALQGGTEPDLLDEVCWWQSDGFWPYALFAGVACIRAAASRAGVPVRQAGQDLAQRPGCAAPSRPRREHKTVDAKSERPPGSTRQHG